MLLISWLSLVSPEDTSSIAAYFDFLRELFPLLEKINLFYCKCMLEKFICTFFYLGCG